MYLVHKPATHFAADVALPPESVRARVAAEAASVRSVVWSPALWETKPFVAELDRPDEIRMRVRHGYSNGFTRIARARLVPAGAGTRLELSFRSIRWVEIVMRAVWLLLLAPLAPMLEHPPLLARAAAVAALTIAAMLGIETVGRHLGDRDEHMIRAAIQTWLGTPLERA